MKCDPSWHPPRGTCSFRTASKNNAKGLLPCPPSSHTGESGRERRVRQVSHPPPCAPGSRPAPPNTHLASANSPEESLSPPECGGCCAPQEKSNGGGLAWKPLALPVAERVSCAPLGLWVALVALCLVSGCKSEEEIKLRFGIS